MYFLPCLNKDDDDDDDAIIFAVLRWMSVNSWGGGGTPL